MFQFAFTDDFRKSLEHLEKSDQESVKSKLRAISKMENPLQVAKRLRGYKNIFRFRAGDYRIVFQFEKGTILLLLVKHRKDIYRGL